MFPRIGFSASRRSLRSRGPVASRATSSLVAALLGPDAAGHGPGPGGGGAYRLRACWYPMSQTDRTPPPPDPLPVAVLDAHTHLDMLGGDPLAAIAAAGAVGVTRLVQVGVDVDSSRWSAALAAAQPAVLATVAVHPNEAPRLADLDEALRAIEGLARQPR